MKEIIIATKNPGKAEEFKTFFAKFNIKAVSLLDLSQSIQDIEETGVTFEENAALKAEQIAKLLNTPVLADDSGLTIDALDGRPGIFSARYAGEPKDDKANIEKVLAELKNAKVTDRTARFVCVLAVATPDANTIFKKGYCEGRISVTSKGSNGFGYDPIFIPKNYTRTMAELSSDEKNSISHRSNAIKQLEDWLENL
ncbi:XTP/dITP diphosphatase [Virgibacillus salinus]|uniref:dITP/XTP pyrophosphatase n=1 Tax=Virgibacillus salinus TaxID=553311 RepID=A0A1H1B0W1_9BACI|nr:XTP/dITP diphosphatase [Virgibacillus salinus]SDQ45543.1 XTP/dITP diphosphohydrolase [Virgibacillus salinus]